MLLPLLGACAVVGPFQGPEWEPVRGLFSKDRSCRDPRCCGNLLVLCLFLIWQARQYWHQVTRTHRSMRKSTKVPPQKWAVPSMRHDPCFGLTPEFFFSPGKFRCLDSHAQQWAQKKRGEYWRSLQESWTQYLLSCQHSCQGLLWDAHTPSEHIFCTTSFSNTCVLPQGSSWEAWQGPWCHSDDQTHLICKPLDMCQRMEQLLVQSQEEVVPVDHTVSMRSHPTSMTSLPHLPSAQRLQFCSREFLPMKPLPKKGDLFLLASGEEEHVASQSMAPAGKNRSSDLPSACPRQAAKALAGIPTALTVLPKWPALKKSQRLLLESLMRRKLQKESSDGSSKAEHEPFEEDSLVPTAGQAPALSPQPEHEGS
ncbi:uncharacterized protein C22orf46 homolog [Sus scrofa]|uniref:uncharacterized protein C22orf46 homolog n=1 Tax=Sus scrofa TaxID=9823 RepID=UPI000A2B183B|nr:uncharacterized protein C22orf46 homolog [Sus scrofa]